MAIMKPNSIVSDVMGGSRISEKGVHMYKGVGVRFAVSLRPNHFIFIGYFKLGTERGFARPPLDPPLDVIPQNMALYLVPALLACLRASYGTTFIVSEFRS